MISMATSQHLLSLLPRLTEARVLCIGDVMLDRFVYGAVDRISPEAPIPVFLIEKQKKMLGGAGNVVANMAALGIKATLLSVAGADTEARDVGDLLQEQGVTAQLFTAHDRGTTVKTRYVGGGQQMLRVDQEKSAPISAALEDQIISAAQKMMVAVGAVVLSDYKKGVLTDRVVREVIDAARRLGKPVIVDPKGENFARYRGASVITPNRKELEAAAGIKAASDDDVRAAAMKIIMSCDIPNVLATRSKDGMSLIAIDQAPVHIPAEVREVYDVSGAGDTVIAVFASALAAGIEMQPAARLSNIAAGIVVGKPGTATATCAEIRAVMTAGSDIKTQGGKVADLATAQDIVAAWREQGLRVGFTNGCFDLLHPGHLSVIRQSKAACDRLILAINSDASVKRLKGPSRPIQDENARAEILASLAMVDLVIVFGDDTPIPLLKALKPDVLVKGGQYKLEEVVGYDIVMDYGGKIVRAEMEDGFSTTNTVEKMRKSGA
jgi:D-beta-D-heptose 7-phosphate kinase/D-beta-D-heptose 1-phosphate adenosyltransferase